MSNGINSPQGLQIVESSIGNGGTQKLKAYGIYASADGQTTQPNSMFSGDPIKWNSAPGLAVMNGTVSPKYITDSSDESDFAAADADAFLGVFISCEYISAQTKLPVESNYWPGGTRVMPGTKIIAYVNDDPMAIFSIQVSSSLADAAGHIFLNNFIGLNANLGVAGILFTDPILALRQNPRIGNVLGGTSAYYLDGNGVAATATLDMKIIGIAPTMSDTSSALIPGVDAPFINVLVRFNKHVYGSAGVAGYTADA
jgi:hypothetical protein